MNKIKVFTAVILFALTPIANAEMLYFCPQNNTEVSPMPVFEWQCPADAQAFSVYFGKDKEKVTKTEILAEDLTGDGKVDYQDFILFAGASRKSGQQYISREVGSSQNKKAVSNVLILNNSRDNTKNDGQKYCHWKPGLLKVGQTYYWRVDTIYADSVTKGDVRQFTASHTGVSENVSEMLSNPDMGWVLQECYPIAKKDGSLVLTPDYNYPGVDYVMLTCAWSDLEKSMGEYDFTAIDYAYDYWKKRGKGIHLRISTCAWGWWSDAKKGLGVPQYITQVLSQSEKQVQNTYVGKDYTVVDARNPFYQERLSAFLKVLAKHFSDEGPRPVALVDLLGYGVWGEWHTGFKYPNLEQRRRALKMIIDTWMDAFKGRWLALSYSHDPTGPKELYKGPVRRYDQASTDTYSKYLAYSAFDYALTIPTVTFRRNGCGGTISSNERKLAEEYFKRPRGGLMVSELAGGYMAFKYPASWRSFPDIKVAIDDCLSLHPNYITIPGWDGYRARNFIAERPDIVKYGLINMGYRYLPKSVEFPAAIEKDSSFSLKFDWVNKGVGKAVQDYELRLIIRKMNDSYVSSQAIGTLDNRLWLKGGEYETTHEVFAFVPEKGRYKLYIEMIDPRDNQRVQLPLYNEIEKTYLIGIIEIQ